MLKILFAILFSYWIWSVNWSERGPSTNFYVFKAYAPYFRVFNPSEQIKKFDKDHRYINKWVTNLNDLSYPKPMVDHPMARNRAIETYKKGLEVASQANS